METRNKEGVPVPALALPLLDRLGLTHPLSCLASVSSKSERRCWALMSGFQSRLSLRIPGSRAPPQTIGSEAGHGAREPTLSDAPLGDSVIHLVCRGVWKPCRSRLLLAGLQSGFSAFAPWSPLTHGESVLLLNAWAEWCMGCSWAFFKNSA